MHWPCLCYQNPGDKSQSKRGVLLEGLGQKNGVGFVAPTTVHRQSMVGIIIIFFIFLDGLLCINKEK